MRSWRVFSRPGDAIAAKAAEPFAGRERQLALLRDALACARAGRPSVGPDQEDDQ